MEDFCGFSFCQPLLMLGLPNVIDRRGKPAGIFQLKAVSPDLLNDMKNPKAHGLLFHC